MEDRDRVREDHAGSAWPARTGSHVRGRHAVVADRPLLAGAARDQRLDVRAEAVARGQAVDEERIDRLLVQDPDVIRLEEGVDDQLPVRRVLGADRAEVDEAVDAEERQLAVEAAKARRRRSIVAPGVGSTQSRPCRSSAGRATQVGVFGAAVVEGLGVQAMAQAAVELVGPAVVRADDAGARLGLAGGGDQAHAAMPADVEEGAEAPVGVAREQQRDAVVVVGEHLARAELAGVAGDQGQRPEQALDLGVADRVADVVLDRDVRFGLGRVLPFEAAGADLGADARELGGGAGRKRHRAHSPRVRAGCRMDKTVCVPRPPEIA